MPCGCCSTKTDCRKMFGIPLAPFALIIALLIIAYESYQIHTTVKGTDWPSTTAYIALALQVIQLVIAAIGFISIPIKWSAGVQFLVMGFKFILFAFIFSFIGLWVLWILRMFGIGTETEEKWRPNHNDMVMMGVTSGATVLLLVLAWWISSALQSLRRVLSAGGNGWEGRNYREIKTGGKKTMVHSDTSYSSDTV
eukprot:Gregarina_sp_Pseudo_9__2831@NODE_3061_length_767_cov_222_471154_g2791_i0_p1_GENE_NODE_3061_length_767_cov_222_471154_g2791_i0NODE_3061_length_767_cov_222_471154_g2791_i0_p1_ORF_typecomplete_len196_score42_78Fig1/PF12351_8/70Fig1/PF12351_8/0_00098DUF1700/PF08006_11/1_6e02DUF1700/PF08006_11/0_02DUF2070/PF09843_9/2_9EptA_B_N/PF08019_12/2_7e02EptA_B_N/PF08019_12/0_237TM_GPCR_Srab/PF10292_9/41_NODE_3061_length_767_cov_222_471154_g2791_i062649